MSTSGLSTDYNAPTLDGLTVIDVDEAYIDGQKVDLSRYVPYTGSTQTLDMGAQNIQTSHTPFAPNDVVNLTTLQNAVTFIDNSVALSFLNKITTTPQTVAGTVTFQSDVSLASRVEVGTNYQSLLDAGTVVVSQYLGTITNAGGVYQATTQTGGDSVLSLFSITAGQRASYTISFRVYDPVEAWYVEIFQSADNITPYNGIIAIVESFPIGDNTFHILGQAFTASITGYICARISSGNPSATVAVEWKDMATFGVGVSLTNATYPSLTADRVAVINDRKQLVSSGISTTKLDYLDNVSSDIQTQLNSKASISYVDTQDGLRVLKAGDTMTGALIVNATVSTGDRILGSVDGGGNFWLGLRGSGTEVQRLAIQLNGDATTGEVSYIAMAKRLDMGANKITTTYIPVASADVLNKSYGDATYLTSASIAGLVPYTGATQGLDMGSFFLRTSYAPVTGSDVVNKTYGDATYALASSLGNYLPLTGGTLTGNINMGSNFVLCNTNPSSNDQLTRKAYVDTLVAQRVPRTGDTSLSGDYQTSGSITASGITSTGGVRGTFFATQSGVIEYNEVSDKGKWFKIMSIDSRAYVEGHITYSVAGHHGHIHFIVSHEFNSNPSIRVVASSFYNTPVVEQLRFATDNASIYNTAYVEMYLGNFDWYSDNISIYVYAVNSSPTNSTYAVYTTTKQAGTTSGYTYQTVVCNVMTDIMMNGSRFYLDSNANMGITGETRTANVFVGSGSYLNCGNGGDDGSESSRTQIAFGSQGSSRQYRHRITSEHNGGDGTGGNGNSLNFYLWSNANGVDDVGTNHRMTIGGAGVGIGTTDPTTQLDIAGHGSDNNYLRVRVKSGQYSGISLTEDVWFGHTIRYDQITDSLRFSVQDNTPTFTDRMTLTYAGNLGINTIDPGTTLDVNGTGRVSGYFYNRFWATGGDERAGIAPNLQGGGTMGYYFGSWNNNNTGGYADMLLLNGWGDGSAGSVNLLAVNKGGKGIRQFQGSHGSGSAMTTWYECVMTDANSGNVTINGNLGIGKTPIAPLTFNNYVQNRVIVLFGGDNDHQFYGMGVNGYTMRFQVPGTSDHYFRWYGANNSTSSLLAMELRGDGVLKLGFVPNPTISPFQATTVQRLVLDYNGTQSLGTGAISYWRYNNNSVAWSGGLTVTNAFYVPNTTCIIHITALASMYVEDVGGYGMTLALTRVGTLNTYVYYSFKYFNMTYNHEQINYTTVIQASELNGIGYYNIALGSLGITDYNDTVHWSIAVMG